MAPPACCGMHMEAWSPHRSSAWLGIATKSGAPKWIRELVLPGSMDQEWVRLNMGLGNARPAGPMSMTSSYGYV